jgi:hypothetical protein
MTPVHPRLRTWLEFSELLLEAGEIGLKALQKGLRRRRKGSYTTLRPGADTPMWNLCCLALRAELKPHGAKVRLARYLGIPKQRLSDFLTGRRRMPDAELALQLLYWLSEKRAGRDPSM